MKVAIAVQVIQENTLEDDLLHDAETIRRSHVFETHVILLHVTTVLFQVPLKCKQAEQTTGNIGPTGVSEETF